MADGQAGFCFIRQNHGGKLVQLGYGRSTGFAIDPIEKKPLNHFYPGTPVLSFGTAGCNLGCKFCQNWDISKAKLDEQGLRREHAGRGRRSRGRPGRAVDRLHLQRSRHLGRIRHRHRARGAAARREERPGHRRLRHRRGPPRAVRGRRRRQRRPQGVLRGVLSQDDGVPSRARARDAEVDPPQERHLAGGDDAADPGTQRQRRRARAPRRLVRRDMAGGSTEAFARAEPILKPMAGRIVHCGDAGRRPGGKNVQQHDPGHFDDRGRRGFSCSPRDSDCRTRRCST